VFRKTGLSRKGEGKISGKVRQRGEFQRATSGELAITGRKIKLRRKNLRKNGP